MTISSFEPPRGGRIAGKGGNFKRACEAADEINADPASISKVTRSNGAPIDNAKVDNAGDMPTGVETHDICPG